MKILNGVAGAIMLILATEVVGIYAASAQQLMPERGFIEGAVHRSFEHQVHAMAGDRLKISLIQDRTGKGELCLTSEELTVYAWTNDTVGSGDIKGPAAQIDACGRLLSYTVPSDGTVTVQVKNDSYYDVSYSVSAEGSTYVVPTSVPPSEPTAVSTSPVKLPKSGF